MKKEKKIVLVGGCFDILHPGHIIFLEKAKKVGDYLVVLLESDEKIRRLKGDRRPVFKQSQRAKILQALKAVDLVVNLPKMDSDQDYDRLITKLKPDIIAVTKDYTNIDNHQRIAKLVGAKLKFVTKKIGNYSTSQILPLAQTKDL
ncbi:adenylyltransferase/cytidyltransferase family protein [Candidatus Daviesbacteria bacterium]|nr:adenylyltransferase/cytidyltransferase family protein [Candidatus Daviesbacteria bacterium]